MLDTPRITQTPAQPTAIIRLTIPREEIRYVMGPGIGELMAALAADFETVVPVTAPVSTAGRVKVGRLPATTVARTVYHGPYEGLGPAWAECSGQPRPHCPRLPRVLSER